MTQLQESASGAQLSAGLPIGDFARRVIVLKDGVVSLRECETYLHAVQRMTWFTSAFPGHAEPVRVVGGKGVSRADASERWIKIGLADRLSAASCEQACLHELAHIVTPDRGPDGELREPSSGPGSSKGHHHAWRVNLVALVRGMLGQAAAHRLRHEFDQWGLPTCR